MVKKFIDSLSLPYDLRILSVDQLKVVSTELREELIDSVSVSGGHFASSLGATELTVAIHALFNTPKDKLIWDVGHQAYIHKMLTGRRDKLSTIRQKNGISGFLKREESEFDVFGAGHAGTSISAGIGVHIGMQSNKDLKDRYTICVIGDGSLTAGMAFEALNHAGALKLEKFIVILNDNEMSISENVGALSRLFSKTVTSNIYTQARASFKHLHKEGYVPNLLYKFVDRAEEATQSFFSHTSLLFEAFGFRYMGPIDGHNLGELYDTIRQAKKQHGPVLIHARTNKGKGYEPAEIDPIKWHGVTPFDKEKAQFNGSVTSINTKKIPTYTQVFAETLIDLANHNPNVVAITAAMPGGTGLDLFNKAHPDKFYDVGICEQHAVTFSAGLACEGKIPVCTIYSTFLQRAYDQVVHDVCIQNLPVIFAIDRGGVVGNDGETHQGVFDIAYLRTIPNLVLMSPKDEAEFRDMLYSAISYKKPVAIRYPRGNGVGVEIKPNFEIIAEGKSEIVKIGNDLLLIAYGPMTQTALKVSDLIFDRWGISSTVINARFAKPLDYKLYASEIPKYKYVAVIEDHALAGGFSSSILELVNDLKIIPRSSILRFGVKDKFVPHGTQAEQHQINGYDLQGIVEEFSRLLPILQVVNSQEKKVHQ